MGRALRTVRIPYMNLHEPKQRRSQGTDDPVALQQRLSLHSVLPRPSRLEGAAPAEEKCLVTSQ